MNLACSSLGCVSYGFWPTWPRVYQSKAVINLCGQFACTFIVFSSVFCEYFSQGHLFGSPSYIFLHAFEIVTLSFLSTAIVVVIQSEIVFRRMAITSRFVRRAQTSRVYLYVCAPNWVEDFCNRTNEPLRAQSPLPLDTLHTAPHHSWSLSPLPYL